jgi:hypothetical protein
MESILRKGTNVFSCRIADEANQCLLGEDGGKLEVVLLVDANNITEHNSNSCHSTNPTIVIIFWSLLGQNILHV